MKITCLFYFVSQALKLPLIKNYMIQLGFRWILRKELEARGKSSEIGCVEKNLWDYSSLFIKQNTS